MVKLHVTVRFFISSSKFTVTYNIAVLPVWLSGNALVSINVVTLQYDRLVTGWVTVLGLVNHLDAEPGIQTLLSLSRPSVDRRGGYPAKAGGINKHIA